MTLPADPLSWAVKSFRDGRNDSYNQYAAYIDGNQPLELATEKFKSAFGRQFATFAYNRCEMVVDAHADRLQIEGFGSDRDEVAQRADALWEANNMDIRIGEAHSDALGLGDSYLLVDLHPITGDVQFWVQDPRNIRIHYSQEAPGDVDLAAKAWQTDDEYYRINLYFRDHVEKYISMNRARSGMPMSAKYFRAYDDGDGPWTYPLNITDTVPIFPIANNARTNGYGYSELRNVLPLQDSINKSVMDMLVAMEFAAFPQRVIIGIDEADASSPEGKNQLARFQAGIDRILTLYDPSSKIAEFNAANIAQYLSVIEAFDMMISRVSRVPVHYLSMTSDFPSGRALRMAEAPFVAKEEDRQRAYEVPEKNAMVYALRLDGLAVEADDIRVNWKSAAPLSQEDMLDMAEMQSRLQFSFQQILREMGYDPEQITTIMEERRREAADSFSVVADASPRAFDVEDEEEV